MAKAAASVDETYVLRIELNYEEMLKYYSWLEMLDNTDGMGPIHKAILEAIRRNDFNGDESLG